MDPLLIVTKVDLSGANQLASGMTSSMSTVRAQAAATAASFNEVGKASDYSMMEARHGVMLLSEELGVQMPRAVSTLIAHIAPVGALMAAAFPILGVIALIEIIGKAISKHEDYEAALRKNAEEEANLEIRERDRADQLQVTNLKLEDQINKIEGRPEKNRLAIALLEAKIKADELATSLSTVLDKSNEALAGEQTQWSKFGDTVLSVWEGIKAGGLTLGTPETFSASNAAIKDAQETIEALRTSMINVQDGP